MNQTATKSNKKPSYCWGSHSYCIVWTMTFPVVEMLAVCLITVCL